MKNKGAGFLPVEWEAGIAEIEEVRFFLVGGVKGEQ
jgi:hypothetical protein